MSKGDLLNRWIYLVGLVYLVICSLTDATLVAIGGGDWHIGEGNFHHALQGTVIVCVHINKNEVIQGKKILINIFCYGHIFHC
jgi:hypothetical protein